MYILIGAILAYQFSIAFNAFWSLLFQSEMWAQLLFSTFFLLVWLNALKFTSKIPARCSAYHRFMYIYINM